MYLTIDSLGDLVNLVVELKKVGLLKDVHSKELMDVFGDKSFPIQVPIRLDGLGILGNPVVKKVFGRKLEEKVQDIWTKALETG